MAGREGYSQVGLGEQHDEEGGRREERATAGRDETRRDETTHALEMRVVVDSETGLVGSSAPGLRAKTRDRPWRGCCGHHGYSRSDRSSAADRGT